MFNLILALFLSLSSPFTDWSGTLKPLLSAVPRLEMQDSEGGGGLCSGVVINKDAGFVLTAAHCVDGEPDLTINGRHGMVGRVNRILDLAVVRFNVKDEAEIEIADASPETGAEIAVVGYPFGIEKVAAQFGRVTQPFNQETKTIWVDAPIIPGNSGGAILDSNGRLVGITSRVYYSGPSVIGAAIPVEVINDFVEPYVPYRGRK